MADPLIGATFDGWKVVAPLGEGSMGTVYEARKGEQRAALKVIKPESASDDSLPRFRREAKLLQSVRNPCVVGCLGTGEKDGLTWLLLEFMEGGTLEDLLGEQGRFTVPQAVAAARATIQGLAAVHEKGIVHRDVKPANLLLDAAGKLKVGDLGLARKGEASSLTATGTILGTPYYMAPEQCRGEELTARTDLYAVGVLLWHLLTGQPPYEAKNPLAILQLHMTADVPDLKKAIPDAPPRLAQVIGRLMAKNPTDRPGDCKAALELLSGLPEAALPRRGKGHGTGSSGQRGGTLVATAVDAGGRVTDSGRRPRRAPTSSASQPVPLPGPRPLPPVPRSWVWGLVVALLGLFGILAALDSGWRAWKDQDPLEPILSWAVGVKEEVLQRGESGFRPWVLDRLEELTIALGWARPHLDAWRHVWGPIIAILLLDRLLARFFRVGLFARLWLRFKASTLRARGEIHAAAKVYELLGDRAKGGELLLAHDLPIPAAEMFAAAGLVQRQGDALMVSGRKREALQAYRVAGSDTTVDAAGVGDTSRESAKKLVEQGKVDEAIKMHRRAGRRYEAADLLENEGRRQEALEELEAAYNGGGGRDYWHHTGKKGLAEEARLALARRIGGLWEELGNAASAASYFEKSGDMEDAARLYGQTEDKRSLARCLLAGIPGQGELSAEHRQRVEGAARALSDLIDPTAVQLWLRVGKLREAADLQARLGEHIESARLYGRVKAFAEGAAEAEKGNDAGLAARLWADAGQFMRASELFEKTGQLEDAAGTAKRAGNREREVQLLQRAGKPFSAAKVLHEVGQPEAALKVLAAVKRDSDKFSDARLLAGDIQLQLGRPKEAAQAYEQGVSEQLLFAEQVPGLLGWAAALEALGEYDKALGLLGRLDGKEFAPRDLAKRKARLQGLREQGASPSGVVTMPAPLPGATGAMARQGMATRAGASQPLPAQQPTSGGGESSTMVQLTAATLTGKTVGNYELLRYVGEGSFAWVFEGRHTSLGREAAIKVLKPNHATKDAAERFLREGRSLAALKNPHLVDVYDMGEEASLKVSYIALEFVKGQTLKKLIADDAPFPIQRAARLGCEILDALAAAHKSGVVHRDLKPANVLIGRDASAKVLDFGLARVFDEGPSGDKSASGAYVGTPRYASPEQAKGEEAHEAADQYAAGLVIYEMLTGKLPFTSKTTLGYLNLHATEPPKPIIEVRPDVPSELAAAVMRALEKAPADRWPSVAELEKVVARYATRPGKTGATEVAQRGKGA